MAFIPFLLLLAFYSYHSYKRHQENPRDKFLPNYSQLFDAVKKSVEINPSNEHRDLFVDLVASLKRMTVAMILCIIASILVGVPMGAFPMVEASLLPFIKFLSFVPPLALLPLVFIFVGIGEKAKIFIIVLGTFFILTRDIFQKVKTTPSRFISKGFTLGASTLEVVFKIMLPNAWPEILHSIRLAITQGWIYLIAAEMVSANVGLGYQIKKVERQLAVNTILWYIAVIALVAFLVDRAILWWLHTFHPYAEKS